MCWRDDVRTTRVCSYCGRSFSGSLGGHGCAEQRRAMAEMKLRIKRSKAAEKGWATRRKRIKGRR